MVTNVKTDPNIQSLNTYEINKVPIREGNCIKPDIINQNPLMPNGRVTRQLMKWRVPGLGFVEMYINPQNFKIDQKKIIQPQRTKGGFVIQYWGEELIAITINGHTGASGIEGINILEKVYRSEQEAFHQVEQILSDRLNSLTRTSSISNFARQASQQGLGAAAGNLISDVLGGSRNPPLLPTLGSLALGVELYYQGWIYKGFFTSFNVTENVTAGIGFFSYDMSFTATERRGIRTNFAPWHRSPATFENGKPKGYNKSDYTTTPLSFNGEE